MVALLPPLEKPELQRHSFPYSYKGCMRKYSLTVSVITHNAGPFEGSGRTESRADPIGVSAPRTS